MWSTSLLLLLSLVGTKWAQGRLARTPFAAFAVVSRPSPNSARDIGVKGGTLGESLKTLIESGGVPVDKRRFLVNGWRWHTMSVIRDLSRFRAVLGTLRIAFKDRHKEALTKGIDEEQLLDLQMKQTKKVVSCMKFVIGFNWKALMGVETKLFFPWLRDLLPKDIANMLTDFGTEHEYIREKWITLENRCDAFLRELETRKGTTKKGGGISQERCTLLFLEHLAFLYQVDEMLVDLQQSALRVQSLQQGVFVPLVAAYVKTQDQERFNTKVVSSLGLLDSQVHLVSMYDAIMHDSDEKVLWKNQIPKIARSVLPLWRKRLYAPKANCLTAD